MKNTRGTQPYKFLLNNIGEKKGCFCPLPFPKKKYGEHTIQQKSENKYESRIWRAHNTAEERKQI